MTYCNPHKNRAGVSFFCNIVQLMDAIEEAEAINPVIVNGDGDHTASCTALFLVKGSNPHF